MGCAQYVLHYSVVPHLGIAFVIHVRMTYTPSLWEEPVKDTETLQHLTHTTFFNIQRRNCLADVS